jgi:hypothetical protein
MNTKSMNSSSLEFDVIKEAKKLVPAIQQSSDEIRLKTVNDLRKLCEEPDNMSVLCSNKDLSLLSSLKQLLEKSIDDTYCLDWIINCLCCLSSGDVSCAAAISSKDLGLFSILLKMLKSTSDTNMIDRIETTISNCSIFSVSHSYLLSSEIGWLDHLEKRLKEKPNDILSYKRFVSMVGDMKNEDILVLINRKIPDMILQKMVSSDPGKKEDQEVMNEAMKFIMYFSKLMNGYRYLKEYLNLHRKHLDFLLAFVSSDAPITSMNGIRAIVILTNVYGRDEGDREQSKALLASHPDILQVLIDIMDAIMNWDVSRKEVKNLLKKGFEYGFRISVVAVALRNLSISDENKKIMIKYPKLIGLACQGIKLFIDDAPECKGIHPGDLYYSPGGGGGKDLVTVEHLLELLVQLSFITESEKTAKLKESDLSDPSYNLKKMMEDLLDLPTERNLTFEANQFAQQLLAKVSPVQKESKPKDSLTGQRLQQHVMLSYSRSTSKDLVVAFGKKLKDMGYDVWRDEEGSSILGPVSMTGNTLDAMTSAVEKSYMMIIFVSPEYKESTICRIEGQCGFSLARTGKPQILYVMMRENYHMEVDGWLGAMIGKELWYPLWNANQLEATVKAVAGKIGDNSKSVKNSSVLAASSSTQVSSFTSRLRETVNATYQLTLDPEADYIAAFECLKEEKSICRGNFISILSALRISEIEDLKDADMKTILTIHGLLKPKTGEKFMSALKV